MGNIEARPYGPNITLAERDALRERVSIYSKDTLLWHEVPKPTIWQLTILGERLAELTHGFGKFYLVIDLTEAERPKPEIINCLRNIMQEFDGLGHVAVYTGKNFMLNIAAKFVLERLGFASYSIHNSKDDALQAIANAKR